MNIDESKIIEDNNENFAFACLFAADVIYCMNREVDGFWIASVWVGANDVFAWGCGDCEPIKENDREDGSEIIELYRMWKEDNNYGPVKWLCLKRNMQPQYPLMKMMKDANYWDESLEKLPENAYTNFLKSRT